jgi:hypothetical protein
MHGYIIMIRHTSKHKYMNFQISMHKKLTSMADMLPSDFKRTRDTAAKSGAVYIDAFI